MTGHGGERWHTGERPSGTASGSKRRKKHSGARDNNRSARTQYVMLLAIAASILGLFMTATVQAQGTCADPSDTSCPFGVTPTATHESIKVAWIDQLDGANKWQIEVNVGGRSHLVNIADTVLWSGGAEHIEERTVTAEDVGVARTVSASYQCEDTYVTADHIGKYMAVCIVTPPTARVTKSANLVHHHRCDVDRADHPARHGPHRADARLPGRPEQHHRPEERLVDVAHGQDEGGAATTAGDRAAGGTYQRTAEVGTACGDGARESAHGVDEDDVRALIGQSDYPLPAGGLQPCRVVQGG